MVPAFDVRVGRRAERVLSSLPREAFERIQAALRELALEPVPRDAKRLASRSGALAFRIRVGMYRVLYEVDHAQRVVLVFAIDKRSRVYDR